MRKYDPLRKYLSEQIATDVTLSFGAIEKLVGPLPKSARIGDAWWVNDSKAQAQTWLSVGWHVKSVDRISEQTIFKRDAIRENEVDSPAKTESISARAATPGESSRVPSQLPGEQIEPRKQSGTLSREKGKKLLFIACIAVVTATVTAIVTLIGLFDIPRWQIFLIALDLSVATTVLSAAAAEPTYRTTLLWISNTFFIALIAGVVIYSAIPQDLPPASATFVRDATAGKPAMTYGHSYLVTLKQVYLPPGTVLWVELAAPLEQTGSIQRYSYFYTQASPTLGSNGKYYLTVKPDNTARLTTDILTAFACSTADSRIVSGSGHESLRKTDGCSSLDYICIVERNDRPKYGSAPFVPGQCRKGPIVSLPITRVPG